MLELNSTENSRYSFSMPFLDRLDIGLSVLLFVSWIFRVGYWILAFKTKKSGLPGEAGGLRGRGKHLENALV